jgi:hypothetical protein
VIKIKRFQQEQWLILLHDRRIGIIRKVGNRFGWRDYSGGHWFSTQQEAIDCLVRMSRQIQLRRVVVQERAQSFGAFKGRTP